LTPPAILASSQRVKIINDKKKEIQKQEKKVKDRIISILADPNKDIVYKTLQVLFKSDSPYNLDRKKTERIKIRNLAKKRFLLGYPPRKKMIILLEML